MTLDDGYLSPGLFWLILAAAFIVLGVYAIVTTRREVRKARAARRTKPAPIVLIDLHCRIWGHAYVAHQTVWLCGVCGDRIPRNAIEESA